MARRDDWRGEAVRSCDDCLPLIEAVNTWRRSDLHQQEYPPTAPLPSPFLPSPSGMAPRSDTPSTEHSAQDPHLHRTGAIPRFSSFPKRHASIDSPREVPLPSPSLRQDAVSPFALAWDAMETSSPFFSSSRLNETVSNVVQGLTSRPSTPSMAAAVPLPKSPPLWSDTLSSPSAPDSSKIPFHMVPRTGAYGKGKSSPVSEDAQVSTETSLSMEPQVEQRLPSSSSSSSSSSSGSTSPLQSDIEPPALEASTSLSSGSSVSIESVAPESHTATSRNTAAKSFEEFMNLDASDLHGNNYSNTFSSYTSNGLGIAYARPTRPPSPSPPYLSRHMSISPRFSRPSTSVTPYYLQPPEPPVILPPESDDELQQEYCRRAPHLPFLRRGPPPADSYIEVETMVREYRILVKLPGFTRDGITLASKKRRILHIVADRWEGVEGHFERRISFGYDADLVQVRAEFDGEMLRVIVPRRPISSGFVAGNA